MVSGCEHSCTRARLVAGVRRHVESLETVLEEANRLTKTYGEQGWESIGSSVQRTQVADRFKEYDRGGG